MEEWKKIAPGYSISGLLCEGCGLCSIAKDPDGKTFAGYYREGWTAPVTIGQLTDPAKPKPEIVDYYQPPDEETDGADFFTKGKIEI